MGKKRKNNYHLTMENLHDFEEFDHPDPRLPPFPPEMRTYDPTTETAYGFDYDRWKQNAANGKRKYRMAQAIIYGGLLGIILNLLIVMPLRIVWGILAFVLRNSTKIMAGSALLTFAAVICLILFLTFKAYGG